MANNTITPKQLIGYTTTPIRNFFMRNWLLLNARHADMCAEVEAKKILQAQSDQAEFQTRAALLRSQALEYK